MVYTVTAFALYLALMIGIGLWCSRRHADTMGDFFLGGRKMNDWVVALSAVVSGRSSWLILGLSGMAFSRGLSAVWAVTGYILVELFMFVTLGKRLRRETERLDALTLPDYYEGRFEDRSHLLRWTSVVIIVLFLLFYVAAQLTAGGKALDKTFGFHGEEIHRLETLAESASAAEAAPLLEQAENLRSRSRLYGVLLTTGIVLLYAVLGGFVAVSLTDLLQAFFMLFGLVVLPTVAVWKLGGLGPLLDALSPAQLDPGALGFGGIMGLLGIGLGSPGNPHILVRFMSIRRPGMLSKAALVGTVWNVLMAWGAIFIGLVARVSFGEVADTEQIFPMLAETHLHPFLVGLMIAAVFAAIMSTVDSQLLDASSAVARDVHQKILHGDENIPEKRMVVISRWVVFIMLSLATVIACFAILYPEARHIIFWLVLFAWAGLGASFGPTLLLALYWKGTSRWGVFAGLLTGTLVTVFWKSVPALKGFLYELIPAFLLALAATWIVSLWKPDSLRS